MKRLLFIVLLLSATLSHAQSGMHIDVLFNAKGKWNCKFEATYITGKMLKPYNLTLFRCHTIRDSRYYDEIESIVNKDADKAISKETGYINGKLYYGFFMFPQQGDKYRYIFYRNSSLRIDEPNELTIVYMEGYCDMNELKNMFK